MLLINLHGTLYAASVVHINTRFILSKTFLRQTKSMYRWWSKFITLFNDDAQGLDLINARPRWSNTWLQFPKVEEIRSWIMWATILLMVLKIVMPRHFEHMLKYPFFGSLTIRTVFQSLRMVSVSDIRTSEHQASAARLVDLQNQETPCSSGAEVPLLFQTIEL